MALSIKVEGIASSGIEEVCEEIIALSSRLKVMVTTNFNGIHLNALPGDDAAVMVSEYHRQIDRNSKQEGVDDDA